MKLTSTAVVIFTSLVVATPLARADGGADKDFVTLDRPNGQSQAGGAFSKVFTSSGLDVGIYRLDLYGQYVTPSGFGGAVSLPFTIITGDGDSESGIGNLGAFGYFVNRGEQADLIFTGGLFVPTAAEEDIFVNVYSAAGARLTDFVTAADATWLRAAFSPTIHSGNVFARGDLGVDIPIGDNDFDLDAILRLNAAVGFKLPDQPAEVTVELNHVSTIGGDDNDDDSVQAFGFSGRITSGTVQPYLAMIIPYLDSADGLSFTVTVGVNARFATGDAGAAP